MSDCVTYYTDKPTDKKKQILTFDNLEPLNV